MPFYLHHRLTDYVVDACCTAGDYDGRTGKQLYYTYIIFFIHKTDLLLTHLGIPQYSCNRSALHLAAACSKLSVIDFLVSIPDININPLDRRCATPLDGE